MKIESLTLKNFKIFKSAEFNFKKITILAGANSAGKTSILNALASIIQNNNSTPFPFDYHNYGENVHLGGFKDIINGGDIAKALGISIKFSHREQQYSLSGEFTYSKSSKCIITNEICTDSDFSKVQIKKTDKNYEIFKTLKDNEESAHDEKLYKTIFSSVSTILSAASEKNVKNQKDNSFDKADFEKEIEKSFKSSTKWEKLTIKKDQDLMSSIQGNVLYANDMNSVGRGIRYLQNYTSYIGPIRPYPSRHYLLQYSNDKLDSHGINSFQMLIEWANTEKPKFKKVISDLKFLKLADNMSTSSIKEELIELAVKPCEQNQQVNISDAGFGLSQILPILVANVAAKQDSTLLINQPEVHLHPSCQAQLANYFAKESEKRNFIIETHSEYLINRFRILVQKGEIKEDDVKIIYIDRNKGEAQIHEIEILKSGSLRGAPKSFFETYYTDINELILGS